MAKGPKKVETLVPGDSVVVTKVVTQVTLTATEVSITWDDGTTTRGKPGDALPDVTSK